MRRGRNSSLLFLCFAILCSVASAASFGESCNAAIAAPCEALLIVPTSSSSNTSLASIAAAFGVPPDAIRSASGIAPGSNDLVFNASLSQHVAVPVSCSCGSRGTRGATATYVVVPDDTLSLIASSKYGNLVTYQEIANASGVSNPNEISINQKLTVPLPCACHANAFPLNSSSDALFASYSVQPNDTLQGISAEFGSTARDLELLNSINATNLAEGQVIEIPIGACKAGSQLIPADSYATFANNCVQCSCGKNDTRLRCTRSPLASASCSLRCANSSLEIGQFERQASSAGCTVRSCLFDGVSPDSGRILTSIHTNTTSSPCTGVQAPPSFAYAPVEATAGGPLPAMAPPPAASAPPPRTELAPAPETSNVANPAGTPPPSQSSSRRLLAMQSLLVAPLLIFV